MSIRGLLLMTSLALVTGCAAMKAYSEDFYYHDQRFAPRKTAVQIRLFEGEKPAAKYVVLGRIVAKEGFFGSRQDVLEELRNKAATLGADAVIDIAYGNEKVEWGDKKVETVEKQRYTPYGTVTKSETRVKEASTSDHMTLSGIAIRFTDE